MTSKTALRTILAAIALTGSSIFPAHADQYGMGRGMMRPGNGSMGSMMQGTHDTTADGSSTAGTPLQVDGSHIPANTEILVSVLPHARMGSDHQRHSAFIPSDYVIHAGQEVTLKIVNSDPMPHTIISPDLGTSIVIPAARRQGDRLSPSVTAYHFRPAHKGVFRWYCSTPCDTGAGGWAMNADFDGPDRDGFMAGYFYVV